MTPNPKTSPPPARERPFENSVTPRHPSPAPHAALPDLDQLDDQQTQALAEHAIKHWPRFAHAIHSARIADATRQAIAKRKDAGTYKGGRTGNPPQTTPQAIARILELHDNGNGPSLRNIARTLNAEDIPTPRGQPWTHIGVKRVIDRHRMPHTPNPDPPATR